MARLARVLVPGYPHHVIQRGNRRQQTFLCDADYAQLIFRWYQSGARNVMLQCGATV